MTGVVIISTIVLAGLLGAALLAAGLRGRPVNDHPICRSCRFDLVGVYPVTVICPECGGDLSGRAAVRVGARRRRPRLLTCAAVCLLFTVGGGGLVGYSAATGYNWYARAPDWLLEMLADSRDAAVRGAALGELATRLGKGSLSAERGTRLIERGLAIQADATKPWTPAWGDLIDAAIDAAMLSDEQATSFFSHACSFELRVRDRIRSGDKTAVEIWMYPTRVGNSTPLAISFTAGPLTFDGGAADDAGPSGRSSAHMRGLGSSSGKTIYHTFEGSVGPHELAVAAEASIVRSTVFVVPGSPGWPGVGNPMATVRQQLRKSFELVEPSRELVRLVPDPSLEPAIRAGLEASGFCVMSESESGVTLDGSVTGRNLPINCVFEVFVRIDGVEHRWGIVVIPAGGEHGTGSTQRIAAPVGDRIDLVFRASESILLQNTLLDSAWGGEIVIEDVPVARPPAPKPGPDP